MASDGFTLVGPAQLPTPLGTFQVYAFTHPELDGEHAVLTKGQPGANDADDAVLCRVHSACLTGDAFHSLRCDCGAQFDKSLERIEHEGEGILIYLNREGRGIGLVNKIRAYELQDEGKDTVEANQALGLPADAREYGAAADVLETLNVDRVRLLTNNPEKVTALEDAGCRVDERVPLLVEPDEATAAYLDTKRDRLGHLLPP